MEIKSRASNKILIHLYLSLSLFFVCLNLTQMAETQETTTVLQRQLKSEYEEDEGIMQSKKVDDQMTLAQFTQTRRSSSLNPIFLLTKAVADNVYKTKSCKKKVSFVDLNEAKSLSTDFGKAKSLSADFGKAESLSAVERAKEIQLRLGTEFPSFVKRMVRSHVSGCFWLGLPSRFCNLQMPKNSTNITLVDENGETYITKFLAKPPALSAGWKGFSVAHKLVEEDALVFQLVKDTKFKVYIVRTHDLTDIDGAFGLLQQEARCKSSDIGKDIKTLRKHKHLKSHPITVLQSKKQKTSPPISGSDLDLTAGQHSGNGSDEVVSEVSEGIRFLGSMVEFKDIENLECFRIAMNSLVIGYEIPEHIQTRYYELCCSQNAFLHEHLLEGFNCQLVVGIISETVNIADAIRASKLSTSHNEFSMWDKSLQAFEQLGMNVGFLRSRLKEIMNLVFDSEQALTSKRYKEAIGGRTRVQEEINTLEENLVQLRNEAQRFETAIKTLKGNAEKHELMFQAKINARW